MNKKAVSARNAVILMVLGLAFTVFMLYFVKAGASEASNEVITRENCGATVDRMDQFNRFNIPVSDRGLRCPTITLTINDKDDEKNNKAIADGMYNCAKQFRRGKKELFTNDGVYCSVCYIFDIQTEKPIEGFHTYFAEKTVPEESGETYYEYMQGYKSEGARNVIGDVEKKTLVENYDEIKLEPGEQYAAIFVYASGEEHFKKVWEHITAQTDAGKAGLVGGGLSFLTLSGGGVAAGLATAAVISGPVGWVVFGVGVGVGVGAFAAAEYFTHYFSPGNFPEHVSFFVFRKWDKETAREVLLEDLKCDFFA